MYIPSKMNAYRRDFNKTKCMSFLIKDERLRENTMKLRKKVSNIIKKEFDSELVYNEKYLKTKIKSYNGKIYTNFHNNKILKEGSQCIFLSVLLVESVYKEDKNYYPQVFLEECKCVVKEKKMPTFITDGIETSDDSDRENTDEENYNEEILNILNIKYRNLNIEKLIYKNET